MAYKQFLGHQGRSRFQFINTVNNTISADVIIENTCPEISFIPLNPPVKNWAGDNVEVGTKFDVKLSLDVYNILVDDYQKIGALMSGIGWMKMYPEIFIMKLYPLYTGNDDFMFEALMADTMSLDNIKKFINSSQKITIPFISSKAIKAVPIIFTGNQDIVAINTNIINQK